MRMKRHPLGHVSRGSASRHLAKCERGETVRRRVRYRVTTALAGLAAISMMLGAGAGVVRAGCGWPNCDPATLAGTYTKTITPPGGSAGTIAVHFQSTADYPHPESWVDFDGSSYAKWLGLTPFNATSIRLTDHWHVDGLFVTFSVPPSFSGGGSDLSLTNQITNGWQINHSFFNLHATCLCVQVIEDATATFQFGSSFYTIQTHDQALV